MMRGLRLQIYLIYMEMNCIKSLLIYLLMLRFKMLLINKIF